MNLVTAFWLLFVASALVSGLALLQSLRILSFSVLHSSKRKSQPESSPEQMSESEPSKPELSDSKPHWKPIGVKTTKVG